MGRLSRWALRAVTSALGRGRQRFDRERRRGWGDGGRDWSDVALRPGMLATGTGAGRSKRFLL